MKMLSVACTAFLLFSPALRAAANDAETVTLDRQTEIPGSTLQPGKVKLEVEDRLQDRAIVRITEANGSNHELVLSVPNKKLNASGASDLIFFPATNSGKQTVKAWKCQSCSAPLEFVYPKDQAVAVTQDTGKAVMAVDPAYDKLPKNLSPDDMKVVTLWLLAPKTVTADGKGSGVEPTKLADLRRQNTRTPASDTVASSATTPDPAMPHTAGSTSEYALAGLLFLSASAMLTLGRRFQPAAERND